MTIFDIIVLFLIGTGALFGLARGFVQEATSLLGWIFIIVGVRLLHHPVTIWLSDHVGTQSVAAIIALLGIVVIIYGISKWIAHSLGSMSRKSVLGPVDRILGFGFGAVKGLVIGTMLFLLITLAYGTIFGGDEQPDWIRDARTYPLLHASADAMSSFVRERRMVTEEGGQ